MAHTVVSRLLDIKILDPPTSLSLISLNGFCGRKAQCFFLSYAHPNGYWLVSSGLAIDYTKG